MSHQAITPAGGPASRGTWPRFELPPPMFLLRSPIFAAVGAITGSALTQRAWQNCPLGNDALGNSYLVVVTTFEVFVVMTVILFLAQTTLWALAFPMPALRCLQWLLPLVTIVILTILYRIGMHSPNIHPDGSCYDGYPSFPFEPKKTPP
ncbi:hypothetical protein [Actinacidiphila sp. bgisy145]|uniref:hypothetical protein n=1 Tax=Actinacidiphila sp. bgisy145 TaxID=3413792 RepID=UPI003EBFEBC7